MNMNYERPPFRPPSEAYSLTLRVMRGCPWNKCTFCEAYTSMKFDKSSIRPVEDVKADIDTARNIIDTAMEISQELGHKGAMTYGVRDNMIRKYDLDIMNFPWIVRDDYPKSAFFGDSNAIVIPRVSDLAEIVAYAHHVFPSIERATSYAMARTVLMKKPGELEILRKAGLTRLHLGLETGDDELLELIKKGVTADEMIEAGRKVMGAGFELSEYVMPGLGGRKRMQQHAEGTARVLNEIDPDFIRVRSLVPKPGTPLYEEYQRGEFQLTSPHERLAEVKIMIDALEITGRVCFDHDMNLSYSELGESFPIFKLDFDGYRFPEEKGLVLEEIAEALEIDESEFDEGSL